MRRWALPLVALSLVLGALIALQRASSGPDVGYMAADFSLPDLNGRVYRLSEFRGKVVFLNLWATWCPPCRMEMPAMERLYQRLKHRDFVILAVSEDETGAESVAPFVAEMNLTFPILLDPEARLSPRYGVTGYPETFVIDRDGRVVNHTIGPAEWDREEYVRYFLDLLEGGKGGPAT